MASFEKWKDKAISLGRAGVSKAKEVGEITKLSLANTSEEDGVKRVWQEIGKLYYENRGAAGKEAEFAELMDKVDQARARIAENKAKIAKLREDDETEVEAEGGGCCCAPEASADACCCTPEVPPEEPEQCEDDMCDCCGAPLREDLNQPEK